MLEGAGRRRGNGLDDDFDDGSAPYISSSNFNQKQQARAGALDALAREREREIESVVDSISQLSEIMKDLGTLVVEQGSILDRVDVNIQETSAKIDEGVRQLVKAERTQRAGRLVLCIMLLAALVLLMLLIIVLRAIF